MVATNTKFTSLALQFAKCKGLRLLGWDDPEEGNLHSLIEHSHLYPITTLTSLSRREKTELLMQHVVLCRDVSRHEDTLLRIGIEGKRMPDLLREAGALCSSH